MAKTLGKAADYDLVILDLGLPDGDGDNDDGPGHDDDDHDDDGPGHNDDNEGYSQDIRLRLDNQGVYTAGRAMAEFEVEHNRAEFEADLDNVPEGNYALVVDGVNRGTIRVYTEYEHGQTETEGEIEFSEYPDDANDLIHAFRFIGNIRLKHQVERFDADLVPNHLVDPNELSRLHQRYLRSAFGIVRRAHDAMSSRYQL